ncbi:phosphatidylinositol-glycan biosynthesis class X protein-like isoform X1 [Uloborus diversus]|uniref:phosphatidylinositol-glycan biosynthesis class X protein-like isoform X1 n=2 Tax=Uloborus diversus TaxID=327109 RepID=UPI0024098A37|nr:phosphatidylinositol-glycan biosynthesis class X protein-like isoform X1 [Uloborus diversus]
MSVFLYCLFLLLPSLCFTAAEKLFSADVERYFLSSGFHRILVYDVILQEINNATAVLIKEMFPKDLYVDPFEILNEMNESKVKIQVPLKFINAEAPKYFAQPFGIELCSTSVSNFHQIFLPIHSRYQEPHYCKKFGDNIPIEMNMPLLKFIFNDNETDKCSTNALEHSWNVVETLQVSNQDFTVPVGCKEDFLITITLTSSTLGLSTIFLLLFIYKFSTYNQL